VKSHRGVDYAAPEGTPVWAAAGGTIAFRGKKGGAGNLVTLKHDNGLTTQYMHLSKFRDGQKVGDRVEAKTVIGYVGATGLATGPHLHFGVLRNGKYVDPQTIEPTRSPGVTKDKAKFEKYKTRVLEKLVESEPAG
jgi:murein DD-endopeptidase MepM/ murein hydrolase activator NlpD